MSPPTVDLSLPSNDQLLARSSPNPETEAAKVTTGDPDQVSGLGVRLQRAGSRMDEVYGQSMQTQRVLAGGFATDGAAVYDAHTHRQALPPGSRTPASPCTTRVGGSRWWPSS